MKLKLVVFILSSLALGWFLRHSPKEPAPLQVKPESTPIAILKREAPLENKEIFQKPLLKIDTYPVKPKESIESKKRDTLSSEQIAVCNVKSIFDCEFCLGKPLSKCMYEKSRIMTTSLEKFYYLHKDKFQNPAVVEEMIDVMWKKNQIIDNLGIQDPFTEEETKALDAKGKILDEEMNRVNDLVQREDPENTIENIMRPSQKEITCMALKNDCLGDSSPLMEEEIKELVQKKWLNH